MSKKKNNSWKGSNTWCIPKKGSRHMEAAKNIKSYLDLSDADKKKYFKVSPVSKEGIKIMTDKVNEPHN